eukprot:2965541-Prymnesium_polylepis.1
MCHHCQGHEQGRERWFGRTIHMDATCDVESYTAVRTVVEHTTETKAQLDAVDGTPLAIDDSHYTATAILRVVTLGDSRKG